MADFSSKHVICPYFRRCDVKNNRICCEGVSVGNTINIVFGSPKRLQVYRERYCYDIKRYRECRVAGMLDQKWEEVFHLSEQ